MYLSKQSVGFDRISASPTQRDGLIASQLADIVPPRTPWTGVEIRFIVGKIFEGQQLRLQNTGINTLPPSQSTFERGAACNNHQESNKTTIYIHTYGDPHTNANNIDVCARELSQGGENSKKVRKLMVAF